MTIEENATQTSWWQKVLAKARSILPAVDFLFLDPEYLLEEKKKTKSLIGGILSILVPSVLVIYLAVLLVDNQKTPPTRNSDMQTAAWLPPMNLTAPRDGYVVREGSLRHFECDKTLSKLLGTKQGFVPVCPETVTGLAYDVGDEEEGVARISSRGKNYGIDVSVESKKNIAVDKNSDVYLIGKHKPYVKKHSTDSGMFYFSRLDSCANAWEDLAQGTIWPDKTEYENAKFTEWVDNHKYLVLVMDDSDKNTVFRVWDFEENQWRHDTNFLGRITAIGVSANGPHLFVADEDGGGRIGNIDLQKFVNGDDSSGYYSELSDLRNELNQQSVGVVDDIVEWAGDIAVIGRLPGGSRLLCIWNTGNGEKARDLEIEGDFSSTGRGILHVYQTKLFVGGWEAASSPQIKDGPGLGAVFALKTIQGDILTDTSHPDLSVHKFVSNENVIFAVGMKDPVYQIDSEDIAFLKVSESFRLSGEGVAEIDCTAETSGRIFCTGNFDRYRNHPTSGVQRSADTHSPHLWGPILPWENKWEKKGFGSEPTTSNRYVFGSLSAHAEPLQLSPDTNSLQFQPQRPRNKRLLAHGVHITFNKFVVSFVEVEDNVIGETYGKVQATEPELLSRQFVRSCSGTPQCSEGQMLFDVEIWSRNTEDIGSCIFDPESLEDFQQNCKEELPLLYPYVIDDQWPVLMLTTDENGLKKWVKVAETPSRLRLSFFEGFFVKNNREITSDKPSAAAVFGQAAGTLSAILTAAQISKLALTKALKKWNERKQKEEKTEMIGEIYVNPIP